MKRWLLALLGATGLLQGCGDTTSNTSPGTTSGNPTSGGASGNGQGGTAGGTSGNGQGGATGGGQGGATGGGTAGAPQGGTSAGGVSGNGQGGAPGGAGGASGSPAGGAAQGGAGTAGQGGAGVPTSCEEAVIISANEGCEFWAVDLDNEPDTGFAPNASAAPWALAVTNPGTQSASVVIEVNDAPVGQPPQLTQVKAFTLQPGEIWGEQMPTREVDGSVTPGDDKAPGTWLSSSAFRITSTAPVVATQYNTATNSFSNDASMLLPRHALGARYVAVGWPAANPALPGGMQVKGLPDRAYLTLVGVEAGTTVQIKPTWRVKAGGPIPLTAAGGLIEATLGPFDVLNLETDDATSSEVNSPPKGARIADLSGSSIVASKPLAVFVGVERGLVPASGQLGVPQPPGAGDSACCTDHLEEQLLPLTALGTRFVLPHSPYRSTGGFKEADVIRFQGAAEPTTVMTNLAAPSDSFTLQPGEIRDAWSTGDTLVASSKPLLVAQLLVSQGNTSPMLGDPALLLATPVEQHRARHAIQAPPGWTSLHISISAPTSATVTIDGKPLLGCDLANDGVIDSVPYSTYRCTVTPGAHVVEAPVPIGVDVFAYGQASAMAFTGGARLAKIYDPPAP